MTARRVLLVLLAVNAVLWGRLGFADKPDGTMSVGNLNELQTAARMACDLRGMTLRGIALVYDERAELVGARVVCGNPVRQGA